MSDALCKIEAGAAPESVADEIREAVTSHPPKRGEDLNRSMADDGYDPTDTWAEVVFAKEGGRLSEDNYRALRRAIFGED